MSLFEKLRAFVGLVKTAETPNSDGEAVMNRAAELLNERFNKAYPASAAHAYPSYPDPSRDYAEDHAIARRQLLEALRTEWRPNISVRELADRTAKRLRL